MVPVPATSQHVSLAPITQLARPDRTGRANPAWPPDGDFTLGVSETLRPADEPWLSMQRNPGFEGHPTQILVGEEGRGGSSATNSAVID